MSKKNKSKFHKRIKTQILQELNQNQQVQKPVTAKQPIVPIAGETQVLPKESTHNMIDIADESLINTKKDLKKSAIIIGSIIIFIIALSIIDGRTNILLKTGNQIFRVLNIQS